MERERVLKLNRKLSIIMKRNSTEYMTVKPCFVHLCKSLKRLTGVSNAKLTTFGYVLKRKPLENINIYNLEF